MIDVIPIELGALVVLGDAQPSQGFRDDVLAIGEAVGDVAIASPVGAEVVAGFVGGVAVSETADGTSVQQKGALLEPHHVHPFVVRIVLVGVPVHLVQVEGPRDGRKIRGHEFLGVGVDGRIPQLHRHLVVVLRDMPGELGHDGTGHVGFAVDGVLDGIVFHLCNHHAGNRNVAPRSVVGQSEFVLVFRVVAVVGFGVGRIVETEDVHGVVKAFDLVGSRRQVVVFGVRDQDGGGAQVLGVANLLDEGARPTVYQQYEGRSVSLGDAQVPVDAQLIDVVVAQLLVFHVKHLHGQNHRSLRSVAEASEHRRGMGPRVVPAQTGRDVEVQVGRLVGREISQAEGSGTQGDQKRCEHQKSHPLWCSKARNHHQGRTLRYEFVEVHQWTNGVRWQCLQILIVD
mmetsp:Transcript_3829/g.8353  ORF Transcript_3829/g.8353 Transcript_3829/m.8353 type:complete len:399 (-) Transcript_3829:57-1253(-)